MNCLAVKRASATSRFARFNVAVTRKRFITSSARETRALGRSMAKHLEVGSVVALTGPLGSGKTTFVKGLVRGVNGTPEARVHSPTFALLHVYRGRISVFHFDWFRLENRSELDRAGFLDVEPSAAVTVIEWAERFSRDLPPGRWEVRFAHLGKNRRRITVLHKKTVR